MKPKISVTIITLNEQKNLAKAINSIKSFANEIIVVDSGSTDKTVDIAKSLGAKTYYNKFKNYANQKNFAAEKATGDWIFSLDADEEVSEVLAEEIKKVIKDGKFVALSIPRKNHILGRFIKHSRWQPELDRHIWLWKKDCGKWVGKVHEEVIVKGKIGKIKNPKLHLQDKTVAEFFAKQNRYSTLEADRLIENGVNFSYIRFFLNPSKEFLVRFFYRLGFLDGWRGFILSYIMAIYKLEVWIKVWSKTNAKSV